MCKKINTIFRCLLCNTEVPASASLKTFFGWITCPEFKDCHLTDPANCSVADWKPAYATTTDLKESHSDCKVWWNRRPPPRARREEVPREPYPGSREEAEFEARRREWQRYLRRRGSRHWEPVCSQ
jgi:hypothetical protein